MIASFVFSCHKIIDSPDFDLKYLSGGMRKLAQYPSAIRTPKEGNVGSSQESGGPNEIWLQENDWLALDLPLEGADHWRP